MATTLDPNHKSNANRRKYVDFDEFIDYQVNKTRAGIKSADLLTAVVTVALVLCGYVLAFALLDQWVIEGGFGALPRLVMLIAVVAFAATWMTWKVVLPYMRRITTLYAAKEIEQSQPELKSNLLTLMDLKRAGRRVSPHITTAMEKRAAVSLSHMDVDQAVDRRPLMRMSYALLAIVVAICLYTVFSPKSISASLMRALLPLSDRAVATRTRIDAVDPGDAEVLARSQLEVTVDLSGEIPDEVTLLYTTADHSLVDEPLAMRDTGEGLNRFRGVLTGPNGRGLLQDLKYTVVAGDARSKTYSVQVTKAPYATVDEILYEYPGYMNLAPRTQSGGEIDAWEGTHVTIRATANMPVTSATLLLSDTEDTTLKAEELPMTLVDSTHLEARIQLKFRSDGTYAHFYRIQLQSDDGQTDPVPRLYSVSIRRDLPPKIELLHPTGDVEMPANGVLPFAYKASDPDFMLRKIEQRFSIDDELLPTRTRTLYASPPERSRTDGTGEIDLRDFDLVPGDVLTFWLTAWDNMEPLGTKSGNSTATPSINIIIVAPRPDEEIQQQFEKEQAQAEQRLDEARQAEEQRSGADDDAADPGEPTETTDQGDEASETEATDAVDGDPSEESREPEETGASETSDEPREGDPQSSEEGDPQDGERKSDPQAEGDDPAETEPSDAGEGRQDSDERAQRGAREGEREDASGERGSRDGQRQSSEREPGDAAADDEALKKLFEEYEDEIEKQREEPQDSRDDGPKGSQPDGSENGDDNSPANEQSEGSREESGGDDPSSERNPGDSSRAERSEKPGAESADETGMNETPGSETGNPDGTEPMSEPSTSPDGTGTNTDSRRSDSPEGDSGGTNERKDGASPDQKPSNDAQDTPGKGQDRPSDGDKPGDPKPGEADGPGETEPGRDPGSDPKPTDMPGDGEPNKDPATQPSEEPTPAERGDKPADTGGSEQPEGADPPPMTEPGDSQKPGDRGSSPGDDENPQRPSSKTGGQPNGPDDSKPGGGREDGQRSEQPASGEKGSSQQASEGTKGGQKPGPGDATQKPGSQTDAEGSERGRPGDKPGKGSSSKSGGDKPGGEGEGSTSEASDGSDMPGEGSGSEGAKPGDGKGGEGKGGEGDSGEGSEGSPGEGSDGSEGGEGSGTGDSGSEGSSPGGSDAPGTQPGDGQAAKGASTGSGGTGGKSAPEGAGNGPTGDLTPEEADLRDKRRATELVLERLQDELERGEVSPELLDELGWSEDNLRSFMQRLENRLADTGNDDSPEARARRRQFETLLRGVDFSSESTSREAGDGPRAREGGFNVQRRPAPSEFQADEEAFKKRLSRETRKK